jgi:hypothetical protein
MRIYDREALALAYVDARSRQVPDEYREALAAGLQRLFGVDLDAASGPAAPLLALFRAVASSYAANTGLGSDMIEDRRLINGLAEFGIAGDVLGDLEQIQVINTDSHAIHLHVLTTLLSAILGAEADRLVTEDELRAIGVDPTPAHPATDVDVRRSDTA